MVGATLALAISHLTSGQLPVTLIESSQPGSKAHPGFDSRALALAAGTCRQLEQIKLWQDFAENATSITDIHVSDQGHFGQAVLDAQEYHLPALGQVIELHEAGQRLFSRLAQARGVRLHCPDRVINIERDTDQVRVQLASGGCEVGQIVVLANGQSSTLASTAGFQWQREDYQQSAIIANVACQRPHQGRAFERFTRFGPLALLPMSRQRMSLVWCHPLAEQAKVMAWRDDQFIDQLQQAFGWRLGRFTQVGARDSYPLALNYTPQLVKHRMVLVGNAAQTLHPIAGQGFNLGLRDAMSLAETLSDAFRQQHDLGHVQVLQSYQQRRLPDRQATIKVTDSLVRLFANNYRPLVLGRNLGLLALDRFPRLKDPLASRTLGWVTR